MDNLNSQIYVIISKIDKCYFIYGDKLKVSDIKFIFNNRGLTKNELCCIEITDNKMEEEVI